MYIGYTINVTNSNEMKDLDERRPYKDAKSSIPPKFAKIMIDLLDLNRPYSSNRILDPFCGAGTTVIACLKEGRQFIGADIDEQSVAKSKSRLEDEESQDATE